MKACELDSTGSRQNPVVDSCERYIELFDRVDAISFSGRSLLHEVGIKYLYPSIKMCIKSYNIIISSVKI
jgi:hypothetical protein